MNIELVAGIYAAVVIVVGLVLDSKRGIPLPLTYSWGAAVGLIANVVMQAGSGRGKIDLVSVVLAILVTGFAAYITAKRSL